MACQWLTSTRIRNQINTFYSTRVIVLSEAQSVVGLDRLLIDKDQLLGRRMVRIIMNSLSTEGIPTLFSQ